MAHNLVIFIQSTNYSTYVNVLTHCVRHEGVKNIYFVGKEQGGRANRQAELGDHIGQIKAILNKYIHEYPDIYQSVSDVFPDGDAIENRVMYVEFSQPQRLISQLKAKGLLDRQLIVDITGCGKRLASDIATSFMAKGTAKIGHFDLHDIVHDRDVWTKSKMYHDLFEEYTTHYHYDDLTDSGVTAASIDQLKGQGRVVRLLLILALILGIVAALLANSDQNNLAAIASIFVAAATSLGLVEDSLNIAERIRNRK
ncbi:MAG: hypothetical protein H6660_06115 [Ardenticatenaceae bacterium]|nr:hypothetical protein [Ardenticatenaceae bacterium]